MISQIFYGSTSGSTNKLCWTSFFSILFFYYPCFWLKTPPDDIIWRITHLTCVIRRSPGGPRVDQDYSLRMTLSRGLISARIRGDTINIHLIPQETKQYFPQKCSEVSSERNTHRWHVSLNLLLIVWIYVLVDSPNWNHRKENQWSRPLTIDASLRLMSQQVEVSDINYLLLTCYVIHWFILFCIVNKLVKSPFNNLVIYNILKIGNSA